MRLFTAALAAVSVVTPHHGRCHRFTVDQAKRITDRTFADTRRVSRAEWRREFYVDGCLRNPQAGPYVRWDRRQDEREWTAARQQASGAGFYPDVASWYDDAGGTACGFHAIYGVANRTLPCGTRVTFSLSRTGRRVTAVVEDRGPFVGGRNWDLNQNLAGALGFGGVGQVWVRIG